ncbi:DUF5615 family PIN-like protein [candidate division KSB1 bacterium]|nr:DUF5615 family PIN-like protein [candidate division KSB1 bacterium]MBL7093032.1 DUF5615 family PIN-like protein [candidate division KSB1 bacterium]
MAKTIAHETLFISIYLDEDIDVDLINPLISHGYNIYCARDEGMLGKSDDEQLAHAAERRWAVMTHNVKHFRLLHQHYSEKGIEHSGIVVSKQDSIKVILRCLLKLFNSLTAEEIQNQLIFLRNFR